MKKIIAILFLILIINNVNSQDNTSDNTNNNDNNSNTNTVKYRKKNGWDYYKQDKYLESIKALEEEKKYFPDRINIYVIEGWDYKELGNFIQMEKVSLEGIKIKSDDIRLVRNLAEAYYYQKKYKEAIPVFESYIEKKYNTVDPYITNIYYYLGDCFYNINHYRKADIAAATANFYKQNDVPTIYLLAQINEKLKNTDKSISFYKKVIELDPENEKAKTALNKLENN